MSTSIQLALLPQRCLYRTLGLRIQAYCQRQDVGGRGVHGEKRGWKPRGDGPLATVSPRPPAQESTTTTNVASTFYRVQFSHLQSAMLTGATAGTTSNGTPTTTPTIPGAASPAVAATSTALSTTSTYTAFQKLQALHGPTAQTSQFTSSSQYRGTPESSA